MSAHLLTILILVPALGALALLFVPRQAARAIRWTSIAFMLLTALLSFRLIFHRTAEGFPLDVVEYGSGYLFTEQYTWVESLGISYKVGVDGISLWLMLLTTILTPIALYGSWGSISTKLKEYAIAFLLLESAMLGTFVALDLFLFYVFWELMLVPMYLIIGVWGGPQRVYAAVKFFLYTMVGSLLMLVAILYLVAQYKAEAGVYSFDLAELSRVVLPFEPQLLCFIAFALAFAIKVPMFPFHTWLPDAHVEAPTGGSVILAAVLLKMGTYGFLRFAMPLFPQAAHESTTLVLVPLAVIGIIYGAYCAWVQRDVKKLVAYSSVSHLGFVMLGMLSMTPQGIQGAILQMINHGISTGALFLLVGVIYDRRHTRDIDEFGGLAKGMPWFATAFVIITMSSIGLPGTNGFIGEFMVLNGAYLSDVFRYPAIVTAAAATGVILGAIYMLHVVLKLFWGPNANPKNQGLPDLSRREVLTIVPLIALVFWIGFFPRTLLVPMEDAVQQFATAYDEKLRISYATHETRLLPPPQDLDGGGDDHEGHDHGEGGGEAAAGGGTQARVVAPAGGGQ